MVRRLQWCWNSSLRCTATVASSLVKLSSSSCSLLASLLASYSWLLSGAQLIVPDCMRANSTVLSRLLSHFTRSSCKPVPISCLVRVLQSATAAFATAAVDTGQGVCHDPDRSASTPAKAACYHRAAASAKQAPFATPNAPPAGSSCHGHSECLLVLFTGLLGFCCSACQQPHRRCGFRSCEGRFNRISPHMQVQAPHSI